MSIVMKDTERENIHENSAVQGAASSVVTGGIVSTIAIPEVGALLIGGPLADAFGITGAAATTVSGQQHEQLPEELSVH